MEEWVRLQWCFRDGCCEDGGDSAWTTKVQVWWRCYGGLEICRDASLASMEKMMHPLLLHDLLHSRLMRSPMEASRWCFAFSRWCTRFSPTRWCNFALVKSTTNYGCRSRWCCVSRCSSLVALCAMVMPCRFVLDDVSLLLWFIVAAPLLVLENGGAFLTSAAISHNSWRKRGSCGATMTAPTWWVVSMAL